MSNGTAAEIEQRLNDDAWLKPGEVAVLVGKSRWTVINWMKNGYRVSKTERIYIRWRETGGGHRELHPEDVLKVLAARRTIHSAEPPTPETPPADG